MYIVSGKHKGRRIASPEGREVRPTASRVRAAVFNILAHGRYGEEGILNGAVADIFCGSGAMGLEAISRGAQSVTFVDKNTESLKAVEYNLRHFGESDRARLLRADSSQLPAAPHPHRLVIMDPPYRSGLAIGSLATALAGGWIAADGVVVLEQSAKEPVVIPLGFTALDDRKYGNTRVLLLGVSANQAG